MMFNEFFEQTFKDSSFSTEILRQVFYGYGQNAWNTAIIEAAELVKKELKDEMLSLKILELSQRRMQQE